MPDELDPSRDVVSGMEYWKLLGEKQQLEDRLNRMWMEVCSLRDSLAVMQEDRDRYLRTHRDRG